MELGRATSLRTVTTTKQTVTGRAWAPDGRSLLYSSWNGTALWRVDTSGNQAPRREDPAGRNAARPVVSSRGHRLAYASYHHVDQIIAMDATGKTRPPDGTPRASWEVPGHGDGIAVSPLGWPVLYTEGTTESDLMLIENFR
jgi:Tol biopolymer transport system component